MGWKSLLGQPQNKLSCKALFTKISKHPSIHTSTAMPCVTPMSRICSLPRFRQWEEKLLEKACSEFSPRVQQAQILTASSAPSRTAAKTAWLWKPA